MLPVSGSMVRAATAALAVILLASGCQSVPEPTHRVVSKEKGYEVREYDGYVVAEVVMPGERRDDAAAEDRRAVRGDGEGPRGDAFVRDRIDGRGVFAEGRGGMVGRADPRAASFPHPLFGDLNLYEWPSVTVLMHEREHQGQIRELLARLRG